MWISSLVRSGALLAPRALYSGTSDMGVSAEPMDKQMVHAIVWTWLGLNIAGQALLLLLLATFLFSRRLESQRHPVMVNFVVTWLLSTFPACLLLYGNGHEGKQPDPGLCLYNAALLAGSPPMLSTSFLAVVMQVFVMMRSVRARKPYVRRTWFTVLLIAMPYATFVIFSLITGIIGFHDPVNVNRDAEIVFCSVRHHSIGVIIWGFTIIVVGITVAVGVCLLVLLWRNWREVRGNSVVDIHLIVRALCFALFQVFMLATFLLSIFQKYTLPPKFMQAIAPTAVFFIFSTQPDVLRSWFVCFAEHDKERGFVRTSSRTSDYPSISKPSMIDDEIGSMDFASNPSAGMPPAMRGVPGLRVSTYNLTNAWQTTSATPKSSGPRPLVLAGSRASPPVSRPVSHASSASDGGAPIALRPEHRARVVGAHHARGVSMVSSSASTYSDHSLKSNGSRAPLVNVRTVDSLRIPQQNGSSYRSDAGVLSAVQ